MFGRNKEAQDTEPVIEFFTALPNLIELAPPIPLRKAKPEWFKKTPLRCPVPHQPQGPPGQPHQGPPPILNSNVPSEPTTIKACAGIADLLEWGWMMPLWCDYEITTGPDSRQIQRWNTRTSIQHPTVGFSGFQPFHQEFLPQKPGEYDFSPKFDSPWLIRTPPGYSIALLKLPYADEEFTQPWRVVEGIIDTDRYHNFNLLLKWAYEGRYILEQGTPMCAIVPFKRSDAAMKGTFKEITVDEHYRLSSRGKGGTGSGDRITTMPYQKWRKQQERAEKNGL